MRLELEYLYKQTDRYSQTDKQISTYLKVMLFSKSMSPLHSRGPRLQRPSLRSPGTPVSPKYRAFTGRYSFSQIDSRLESQVDRKYIVRQKDGQEIGEIGIYLSIDRCKLHIICRSQIDTTKTDEKTLYRDFSVSFKQLIYF